MKSQDVAFVQPMILHALGILNWNDVKAESWTLLGNIANPPMGLIQDKIY